MYEKFYGLNEKPFELLPDPSFLYMSKGHREALTLLRYSIASRQAFSVFTGEVGSGKTTLINQIVGEVGPETNIGMMSFTHVDAHDLGEWIMMAFGLDFKNQSKAELYDNFIGYLINQYAKGKQTVLIIDEAQNMRVEGLENARMLSNVNARKEYLLHLILVGQPELQELLKRQDVRQLTQRVSVAYHLKNLSVEESMGYIEYRLKVAGAKNEIITSKARHQIALASYGIPRLINTICDLALVYGFSEQKNRIDADMTQSVLEDRAEMGLIGDPHRTGEGTV